MKCRKCGKELKPGVKFCGKCGSPVDSAKTERETQVLKRKTKKIWIAAGVLLVAGVVGIVGNRVFSKKQGEDYKEAVVDESKETDVQTQNDEKTENESEEATKVIYLPTKTTMYYGDGSVSEYTVCVYQQVKDGIMAEEITYPAAEGREAWNRKKKLKYDLYGRKEWEYNFVVDDNEERFNSLDIYSYENDGSYYREGCALDKTKSGLTETVGYEHYSEENEVLDTEIYSYFSGDGTRSSLYLSRYMKRITELDKNGMPISASDFWTYFRGEEIEEKEIRSDYDENGNKLSETVYDSSGNLIEKYNYYYDEHGEITPVQRFDSNNQLIQRKEYDYENAEGTEYTVAEYDENDIAIGKTEYCYDINGKLLKQFSYDITDGKENFRMGMIYTYDQAGNVSTYTSGTGDEKSSWPISEYEYQTFKVLNPNTTSQNPKQQSEQQQSANVVYLPVQYFSYTDNGSLGFWQEYDFQQSGGQYIGTGKMYFNNTQGEQECLGEWELVYDSQGREVEETFRDIDSSYTDKMSYDYEENGDYTVEYETSGSRKRYSYNKDKILLAAAEYQPDSGEWKERKIENEYDDEGRVIVHREYGETAGLTMEEVYSYDENGRTSTVTNYDEQGQISSVESIVYDQNGNVLQSTTEKDGEITQTWYQRYDANGNLLYYESYDEAGRLMDLSRTEYQAFY